MYEWIQDARLYENPDFRPVDDALINRFLKVALVAIDENRKDFPGRRDLELNWCPLFLHFKNNSRESVALSEISNIFMHNVIKPHIPADIQIQILKDIPFSRYSKEAVRLYTATLMASENIYDMTLKLYPTLLPILKSCADPSLGFEMISTVKHIKSVASRFAIEKDQLFYRIIWRLVRLSSGSEEICSIFENQVKYYDILFLKNTYFKDSEFGMRQADVHKENLSDVLMSHCIFEKMEDMVKYTLYAQKVVNNSGNSAIQVTLLQQARFLYDRGYYAASATLLEAICEYFSESLLENVEKESAKLHQHAILSFYIQSQDSLNQINDWIDVYYDGYGESSVLGKLCMALFIPKDKMQENNSFAILNRLVSILGKFQW